eukprot:CAMPEP_0178420760 /NCGR_PEP_ID=MMETSP0689_2-20121128/26297_1 /TAXON_ID=160604 /ORGANISM="Amphidinium massartii, Strain CS-259" /LENGTH=136 /DNA_ID=CAMNT_0020042249 /DNA_START=61 /DNA_END=468 /DNA_ORIENTATION=+
MADGDQPKVLRKVITKEELAKHSTEKDCWIAVHDLVLELPEDFLNEHPGGGEVITVLGGREVTSEFEDIAHSDTAREWANKYIKGVLEGAPEEAHTKLIPKTKEVHSSGAGGGLGGLGVVAVAVAIIAILAYFFVQ